MLNALQKEILFNRIWAKWPKQEGKPSAKKGFDFVLNERKNIDGKRLLATVDIYLSELKDVKYCRNLGNFFRDDHYRDIYDGFDGVEKYKTDLQTAENSAKEVVLEWNKRCRPHWNKVENVKDRVTMVKDSMHNDFFKKNWRRAMARCVEVFSEKFEAGDWRRKITPSLAWFCNVHYDNHTVSKIIEGEYGKANIEEPKRIVPEIVQPATEDEVEEFFKNL